MVKAPNPLLTTLVLSAAAALGYVGYRVAVDRRAPAPADAARQTVPASHTQLADNLPEFRLDDLAGKPQSISDWRGKPMLINFWATWCGPCRQEIPLLKKYQSQHSAVQVVGIAVDSKPAVESFAKKMEFNYPVLVGQTDAMEAAAAMGVDIVAFPFSVFVGPDGHILGMHTGELHPEHLANWSAVVADLRAGRIGIDAARARLAGRM
jgi:thiol-disulfide isomerase/thioredoxin